MALDPISETYEPSPSSAGADEPKYEKGGFFPQLNAMLEEESLRKSRSKASFEGNLTSSPVEEDDVLHKRLLQAMNIDDQYGHMAPPPSPSSLLTPSSEPQSPVKGSIQQLQGERRRDADSENEHPLSQISGSPPHELPVMTSYHQQAMPPAGPNVYFVDQRAVIRREVLQRREDLKRSSYMGRVWNKRTLEAGRFCVFCKKNNEHPEFYKTHVIKDLWGRVVCPVLRSYVCPRCGATGNYAHTRSYCPHPYGPTVTLSEI